MGLQPYLNLQPNLNLYGLQLYLNLYRYNPVRNFCEGTYFVNFCFLLVKCKRDGSSNFTDSVKKYYVIKTNVAITYPDKCHNRMNGMNNCFNCVNISLANLHN